jgi:6-phosphogluconolactonase
MKMDIRVFPDLDALSRGALEELLRSMHDAIQKRGRFAIALAGGHTPAKLYALWAESSRHGVETPWDRVHLFFGDERYLPADSPLSNYRMVKESLINGVRIPAGNVHPMPTREPLPEQGAEAYEADLRKFFGAEPPALDLQLLGLGPEGHTASLFPGSPVLEEKKKWVAAVQVEAKPKQRLTLTPVVLNLGRKTLFLVAGADKREIVGALKREPDAHPDGHPSQYPAAQIRPAGGVIWLLDQAAAE